MKSNAFIKRQDCTLHRTVGEVKTSGIIINIPNRPKPITPQFQNDTHNTPDINIGAITKEEMKNL